MSKQSLSIIGVGAFGGFMLQHLTPHYNIFLCDPYQNLESIAAQHKVNIVTLEEAAQADIVVIAVPVKYMDGVVSSIAPFIRAGQLVMDVASVKCLPASILKTHLTKPGVDLVGLHPLFGPRSGKNGIEGLNITVAHIRGDKSSKVAQFLSKTLKLNVIECTPEEHDMEVAYVQGLTHMIAKVFRMMNVPEISQTTKTFDLLAEMASLIKHDSDDLFKSILTDNPYVEGVRQKFFDAIGELEDQYGMKHIEQ